MGKGGVGKGGWEEEERRGRVRESREGVEGKGRNKGNLDPHNVGNRLMPLSVESHRAAAEWKVWQYRIQRRIHMLHTFFLLEISSTQIVILKKKTGATPSTKLVIHTDSTVHH